MKKLLAFWVSFWILCWGSASLAQNPPTPNIGLLRPEFVPNTWGEDFDRNWLKLDTFFPLGSAIPRVTVATLPTTPLLNQVVVVTDASSGLTCATGGGTSNNMCQWTGANWVVIGGGGSGGHIIEDEASPLTSRTNLNFTGAGVSCADSGGKTVCTITGSALSISGTGLIAQTSAGVYSARTITGSGGVTVTNGGGVSGAPAISLDSSVVKNNQSNPYTTGDQSFANATSLTVPTSPGAAPTASGRLAYDSTSDTWKAGRAGTTETFAWLSDLQNWSIASLQGLDTDFASTVYTKYEAGAGTPAAGSCDRAGQLQFDTTPGSERMYFCPDGAVGNPIDPGGQSDGFTGISDGTNAATATGSETFLLARAASLGAEVKVFTGTGTFSNQPANDSVELLSTSASDTGADACVIYGTTNGADQSNVIIESRTLSGTTPVTSAKLDWGKIYALDCSGFTQVGTITIRENSGDLTITTIAPGGTAKAANQDTVFIKAAGGGGTAVQYVEMRLDGVRNTDNNAIANATFGTNFTAAYVQYADNAAGRSTWSAYIPVASSSWNMVLHNKPASGAGTAVSLEVSCRVVANNVLLDSTRTWIYGVSGNPAEITVSSSSANLNVTSLPATLALTAGSRLYCDVERFGADANDNLSVAWQLMSVVLEITP